MIADRITQIVYPVITLGFIIGAWFLAIDYFQVSNYVLPSPGQMLAAFERGFIQGVLWPHVLFTMQSLVLGYALGCSVAFALGSLLAESRTFEKFVYPYVIALQSTPKVALAPLIIVWFGFDLTSKVVLVGLICFFPVFVNTLVGVRQANADQIDLLRVFSASRLHIFLNVKLPAALGSIFAGLQIAVVLGLIGAVVGEFIGARRGLGFVIQSSSFELNIGMMFTCVLALCLIGIAGTMLVRFIHARVVFWEGDKGGRASVATA
jgi:NitT/TauT family transport system permease protein